jgi:hypothetical protein
VLDVLEASEKCGVERGRGDLAHPSAEVLLEDAVADDDPLGEAVCRSAITDRVVEAECLPGLEDRAVDEFGGPAEVRISVRGMRKIGGEARHPFRDL